MTASVDAVRSVLSEVKDPEIPVLGIDDLGIVRDVRIDPNGRVEVDITPTYSGCPAIDVIQQVIEATLQRHGYSDVVVRVVLSPAWTTDWMSEDGRRKLHEYGIAPPGPARCAGGELAPIAILCPQCGSAHTQELSRFASTPCKALHRCTDCREPFDHFKPH